MASSGPSPMLSKKVWIDYSLPKFIAIYGSITSVLLIIYFSIAAFLDFSHLIDYRYLNIFFQAIGAFLGLIHFHRSDESKKTNYVSAFVLAAGISAFASLIFSISI